MTKDNGDVWGISRVWNASLIDKAERKTEPRDHLWASELGKSPIDLYLKLKGVEPTNLPNDRSKRKFEAGNIFEWIVGLILLRAGILRESQKWVSYQYPGLLEVTGKADYIAGGKPDYDKAREELNGLLLPEVFMRAGSSIIDYLEVHHPDGLIEQPIEVKSVSSFMFEAMLATNKPLYNHAIQLYHYIKACQYEYGTLVYICRDDLRMAEFVVKDEPETEEKYRTAIETITDYYNRDEQPPLEKAIVWDTELKKFAKNFNIGYSMYLTKLYGFKDQAEFDDKYTSIVEGFNRVITRIKDGKDMTENNKEKIGYMTEIGFDIEEIKKQIVK